MRERVEGLVEGIRRTVDDARKTFDIEDIEAGPLLQALNMITTR